MKCTVVGCKNYSNNVTHVCYCHLPVGAPERCELWLLAIRHLDVNTQWKVLHQNSSVLCVCSNCLLESDYAVLEKNSLLKKTAVPSAFPNHTDPQEMVTIQFFELESPVSYVGNECSSTTCQSVCSEHSIAVSMEFKACAVLQIEVKIAR